MISNPTYGNIRNVPNHQPENFKMWRTLRSVYRSAYLPTYLSTYLSVYLSTYLILPIYLTSTIFHRSFNSHICLSIFNFKLQKLPTKISDVSDRRVGYNHNFSIRSDQTGHSQTSARVDRPYRVQQLLGRKKEGLESIGCLV